MKKFKSFIIITFIFSIIVGYILPIRVYAADETDPHYAPGLSDVMIDDTEFNNFSGFSDQGFASLDGIVGLFTWFIRAPIAACILTSETIISQVVMGGDRDLPAGFIIDMEDIIFSGGATDTGVTNEVNILDVNFFDFSNPDSSMNKIKENVAKWYYIIRNIAIGISLLVLIYLGIRMAISSIAEDQAKYKTMLKDWVVGLVILFTLHIIMAVLVNLNSQLVGIIRDAGGVDRTLGGYETVLMKNMFSASLTVGFGSILIVLLMLGMKIAFFWMYLKRLFNIGFLIVISPLITITYSIDKIGDGKSQALGTWLREFIYNLLIQPFHCIIYLIFVTSGLTMLETGGGLRAILFSLMAMLFIFKAEDIVKTIFGFRAGSLSKLAEAAAVTNLLSGDKDKGGSSSSPANAVGEVGGGDGAAPAGGNGGVPGAGVPRNGGVPGGNGGAPGGAPGGRNPGGAGVGNVSGGAGRQQPRTATASKKDKFRSKLNQIKNKPGQVLGEMADGGKLRIKSLANKAAEKSFKAAPGIAAGLVGAGMSGSAITGYAVGKKVGKKAKFSRNVAEGFGNKSADYDAQIAAIKESSMEEALKDQEERDLIAKAKDAYNNYADWHPDADMDSEAERLLYENPDDIHGDTQARDLAKSLEELNAFYEEDSLDGSEKKALDQLKGNPQIDSAIEELMDHPNYALSSKTKLMNNADRWLDQMDAAKTSGKNYLKSDDYKKLSGEEKNLAKKMYAEKKVLETRYNSKRIDNPNLTLDQQRQLRAKQAKERANDEIKKMISSSYDKHQDINS
ncbi:MAG: hypothetical protein J6I85_07975 [Clostridia bacterium]|nr:hypothetical protein [Clostridia bacterium]